MVTVYNDATIMAIAYCHNFYIYKCCYVVFGIKMETRYETHKTNPIKK